MDINLDDALDKKLLALKTAKKRYRQLQAQADSAKTEHDVLQAEAFEMMRSRRIMTLKAEDAAFSRKATIYGHVRDRELFANWCRENGYGDELLVQKENSRALNEIVRGLVDNGEDLPPGVGFYAKEYISITESKE